MPRGVPKNPEETKRKRSIALRLYHLQNPDAAKNRRKRPLPTKEDVEKRKRWWDEHPEARAERSRERSAYIENNYDEVVRTNQEIASRPERNTKISNFQKGKPKSEEHRQRDKEANLDPEVQSQRARSLSNPDGTTLEQQFDAFLQSITPLFTYGGNAYLLKVGKRWPDWFNEERCLAVDLFSEKWHSLDYIKQDSLEAHENERIGYFADHGWQLLIVWENDYRERPELVKEQIINFIQ